MAVAAYARIAQDLKGKIAARDIKPGGPLPSELELRDQYQASRNTVLDAIKKLKDEGLVETRPGQGWFARVKIVPFDNSLDWGDSAAIEQARARGRVPRVTPPVVRTQTAPPKIAAKLLVPVGTAMIVRRQEWFLDDLPWKLQDVWCPRALFDAGAQRLLLAEDIGEGVGSYLSAVLRLHLDSAAFYFLPRKPTPEEAKFFGFPAEGDVPYVIELVRTTSVAGVDGARPLYVVEGLYAGDRNRFEAMKPVPGADSLGEVSPSETR